MQHSENTDPLHHIDVFEQTLVYHLQHRPKWALLLVLRQRLPAFENRSDDDILIIAVIEAYCRRRDTSDMLDQIVQKVGKIPSFGSGPGARCGWSPWILAAYVGIVSLKCG